MPHIGSDELGPATNLGPSSPIDEALDAHEGDEDGAVREDAFEESEEARKIQHTVPKRVKQPIEGEIEVHDQTHGPFRSWCKFCVSARAPHIPHRARNSVQSAMNNEIAALVGRDRRTGTFFAHAVPHKGDGGGVGCEANDS